MSRPASRMDWIDEVVATGRNFAARARGLRDAKLSELGRDGERLAD